MRRVRTKDNKFKIQEMSLVDIWFQQTSDTARDTVGLIKTKFDEQIISRFKPVNWPPKIMPFDAPRLIFSCLCEISCLH